MLDQQAGDSKFDENCQEWLIELSNNRNRLNTFNIDFLFNHIATRAKATIRRFAYEWFNEILQSEISEDKLV